MTSESDDNERFPKDPLRLLLLIVAVGAALRAAAIERQSFWYDEAISALLAKTSSFHDMAVGARSARDAGNPPLHIILLRLWGLLFGAGDTALRSLSAVFGVASIPLVYTVGRRLAGVSVALVAAAVFAFAPFHVYFAQETRTYALTAFLCLASIDLFLRAVEAPRKTWVWPAYGVTTFLSIYSHYFAAFVVLGQLLHALVFLRSNRRFLVRFFISLAGAAVFYALWLPALFAQMHTSGNLGRSVDSWYRHMLATPLVWGVSTTLLWKDNVTPFRVACAALALLSFVGAAALGVRALRARREALSILLSWMLMPLVVPLLVSVLLFPLYNVRYALLASPSFYILVAAGILAMPRRARVACVAGMALPMAASLFFYFTTVVKPDWRSAAAYLQASARPDDIVLFDADIGETALCRYATPRARSVRLVAPAPGQPTNLFWGTPAATEAPRDTTGEIMKAARVWLVSADKHCGSGGLYKGILDERLHITAERHFRGIDVEAYER